jgi:diaminopimelate epimerase
MLLDRTPSIRLFNSDGSEPELSGNGTRCAAAFLIHAGLEGEDIVIRTGAGNKALKLIRRKGVEFELEMNMGRPRVVAESFQLELASGPRDVTLIDCGNPQCAVPVRNFDFDWVAVGQEIERHPHFPNRTNVSFIRSVDEHTIDVRFFERGAGATMSSGTGSTGAAFCAMTRGFARSPIKVLTQAGPLEVRQEGDEGDLFLIGPAVLVAHGTYFYEGGA